MKIHYSKIGVCGLSCRLCPMYHTKTESRCDGCKSPARMTVGCPFITCAVKKREIEFCWLCMENATCERWKKHQQASCQHDSFKCYQKLEDDIAFIREHGLEEYEKQQKTREDFLKEMLEDFNDGRSKSYFCITATVLTISDLEGALSKAKKQSKGMQPKEKAKVIHSIVDALSKDKGYLLKLRK